VFLARVRLLPVQLQLPVVDVVLCHRLLHLVGFQLAELDTAINRLGVHLCQPSVRLGVQTALFVPQQIVVVLLLILALLRNKEVYTVNIAMNNILLPHVESAAKE